MKKIIVMVIVLAIIGGAAFAGDNQSAKYIRMLSREAATDSIDIAYFNPAGTAFLQEGFHVQLNGQTVWLNYSHDFGGTTYEMKNWVPFVPAAYLGYNGGKWAVFFHYNIPEGGGSLDYDSVAIAFDTPVVGVAFGSLEATSATHALSLGGSYRFNDIVSVGVRGEMSIGSDKFDTTITSDTIGNALVGTASLTTGGIGFGGAFGLHVRPAEGLNISATIETSQKIEMEEKESSGTTATLNLLNNAAPSNVDRPWKIRTGLSYAFPFGLEIPVSFKYNFWEAVNSATLKNSWSTALGLRYWVTEGLEISVGGSYSTGNVQEAQLDTSFLNPELDGFTIAGGIGWEIFENFDLDIGLLYPIYFEADGANYTNMKKQVFDLGLGVGYVF